MSLPGFSANDTTEQQLPWIPTPAARPPTSVTSHPRFSYSPHDFVLYGSDSQSQSLCTQPAESQDFEADNAYDPRATTVTSVNSTLDHSTGASASFQSNQSQPRPTHLASNLGQFSIPSSALSFFEMAKSTFCLIDPASAINTDIQPDDDHALFADEPMEFTDVIGDEGFGAMGSGFKAINAREHPPAPASYTVSPQELSLDHSAPNSNTFTNLTTPSMYDGSPDDLSSFEASPLFSANVDGGSNSQWPSLFADEDNVLYAPADKPEPAREAPEMSRTSSADSTTSHDAPVSPALPKQRMSINAGVHKNKRTGRLLGPIEVDEADCAAVKRAKNTLAARKSRQKKRDVEDQLRLDLSEMTAQRDRWMHIAIAHGAPLPDPRDHKSP